MHKKWIGWLSLPLGLGLLAVAVLVGLGTDLAVDTTARAASTQVAITNFQFTPGTTTVSVGDSVTWMNNATSTSHTTTSDSALWNSGPLSPGQSFSFTFTTAGTFTYHCAIHTQMLGSIVVQAAAATGSPTSTATVPPTIAATSTPTATTPAVTPPPAATTHATAPPAAPSTGNGTGSFRQSDIIVEGGLGLLGFSGAAFVISFGARRRRV